MLKRDYYLQAMQSELYLDRNWVISAFAVVRKRPQLSDVTYPYQLCYHPDNPDIIFTAIPNPDGGYIAEPIEGSDIKAPLYIANQELTINKGEIPLVEETLDTTYGIILGNMYLMYYPFGGKFKFHNDEIPESITDHIATLLVDDVDDPKDELPNKIYVRELLRFAEGCDMLGELSMLFSFSGSNKLLSVDPAVLKLRDELIAKHKHELHDIRVQAMIEKAVTDADKASFKGDPSEKFLITGKSFNPTRKKRLIMIGGSAGFGGAGTFTFIPTSLRDGWRPEDLPSHANDARAGSFFRGKETAAGGTEVNKATQMGMNTRIVADYCGATVGLPMFIDKRYTTRYIGRYIVNGNTPIELTTENVGQYVGKHVPLHSPSYCKTPGDAYCFTCIGKVWSRLPNGLNNTLSNTGDVLMYDKMKRMHGKALKLATINLLLYVK